MSAASCPLTPLVIPAWTQVFRKSTKKNNPVYVTFCTIYNNFPYSRTIVYRGMTATSQLIFHTDVRAHKVMHIAQNSSISVCWYGARTRDQFRFEGRAKVIHPSVCGDSEKEMRDLEWSRSSENGKLSYGCLKTPGVHLNKEQVEEEEEDCES